MPKNGLRIRNPSARTRTVPAPEHLPVRLDEHHLAQRTELPADWPRFDALPAQPPVNDE